MKKPQRFGVWAVLSALFLPLGVLAVPASAAQRPHTVAPSLSASPASIDFGSVPVGDISDPAPVTLTNNGTAVDDVEVRNVTFGGTDPNDFIVVFPGDGSCQSIQPNGGSCTVLMGFLPGAAGARSATVTFDDLTVSPPTVSVVGQGTLGYWIGTANGAVLPYGNAAHQGDASGLSLHRPIVGIASTLDDFGYWVVATDGGIFNYGDADFFGSTGGLALNKPIVGMAGTPDAQGYYLVASDGGIFTYGDAQFQGSTGSIQLNKPIVGMAMTPDGFGYWLVASDGGIFSYGDAQFYGSTGSLTLNKPIVGMAATPDGGGYWLVASDGGIFSYGNAQFYGSTGSLHLVQPIVGMTATPDGAGYWMVAADGGLFNYGDAPFLGSAGGSGINNAIGIASSTGPTLQAIAGVPALRAHVASRFGLHGSFTVRRG